MKQILQISIIVLVSLFSYGGFCQTDAEIIKTNTEPSKADKGEAGKAFSKADKAFENLEYSNAIKKYLKVIENNAVNPAIMARIADSYFYIADYGNASRWYGKLKATGSEEMTTDRLHRFAIALKSYKNYKSSDEEMRQLSLLNASDSRGENYINEKNYLQEIKERSGKFEIKNLDINSNLYDFAPSFYKGQIIFSSNRGENNNSRLIHSWNDQSFLDLYTVNPKNNQIPILFSDDINTEFHESTSVSTKDGNTIYFTRNNYLDHVIKRDTKGVNRLKIYRATRQYGDSWKVSELPFNSDQYSVAHPALNEDETELYFSSDMPGSKGESDLYKVAITGDKFGDIVSLGDVINTEGRETFPFIGSNNKLYFSSDGHQGLGGLDIFEVSLDQLVNQAEIYNLGAPINSPKDDVNFIIDDLGNGYLASNRDGGLGEDDIYGFKSLEDVSSKLCKQQVVGVVTDKVSGNVLSNALVIVVDDNNNVIEKTLTDDNGAFEFDLACNTNYTFKGSRDTYDPDQKTIFVKGTGDVASVPLKLKKDDVKGLKAPEVGVDLAKFLNLNPIYFDLDKSFIRLDAEIELQKIIVLMRIYPNLKIDVRSHTDSRNTDEYNAALSDRRAKSTIEYLVRNNINQNRITGRGYGESQLVNRCSNGVKCSKSEHQLNRRSEFIVIEN